MKLWLLRVNVHVWYCLNNVGKLTYCKTSNKRPWRLFEQSANTPGILMENRRLLETWHVLEVLQYLKKNNEIIANTNIADIF